MQRELNGCHTYLMDGKIVTDSSDSVHCWLSLETRAVFVGI